MRIEDFVNDMIGKGWILEKWKNPDHLYFKLPSDENLYIRIDIKKCLERDYLDYFVTFGSHKEAFPRVDTRNIGDFLKEENGTITCTKQIRRDFMEDTK